MKIKYLLYLLLLLFQFSKINCSFHKNKYHILKNDLNYKISIQYLIESRGYPFEQHYITTNDGYILTAFRIPFSYKRNQNIKNTIKKPIILQHGLLDNSATWLFNNDNESLPFILSDNGSYDIWLTNSRGNRYSLNHTQFNSDDVEFWQFTFDDMAKYDIIANVNYILNVTGSKNVAYIGHSQGTTIGFLSYLYNPDLEFKMPTMFALAPVANISHMSSPLLNILVNMHTDKIYQLFGTTDFMPFSISFHFIKFCTQCKLCCSSIIESIFGLHQSSFNSTNMPIITELEPGGTSIKNMVHFIQLHNSQKFQNFDYGDPFTNFKIYNSTLPPKYDLSKLPKSLNLFFYSGKLDILSTPIDVSQLLKEIPPSTIKSSVILPHYSHIDFVWALDAKDSIYYEILNQLKNYY